MADKMLDEWAALSPLDPFERTCVVVGDMATRNWLKDRFLLHTKPAARRILANVDFTPLPEFANDWLAAAVHGREGAETRDPADHPFSKGVMAWRIDAILREKAGDPGFKKLADYIAAGGDKAVDRRRFDLAVRLAQMFDDYLVSRHAMLHSWERGKIPSGGDERWQALLYRQLLVQKVPSYAADYEHALASDVNPEIAFKNGFPRYAAVHVFDVMDAPWPYLAMLKKISETIPVTFWTFNPSRGFWLEDPTKRQLLREKASRLRTALENGENPEEEPDIPDFSSPNSRLLGALATGARGMLSNELDLTEGDCEWLGDDADEDFQTLRTNTTEVHVCHSPRRELEAARDALHRFFAENQGAKFSDALILCADWQTYAPLIEAVFSGRDAAGNDGVPLPIAAAGMSASTPIAFSFGELLDFRTNRFEVSKVFALLGVPEIRDKFGIDSDGLSTLRDMARKDNIHWGYDDADVRSTLWQPEEEEIECPHFTWRRGLDRLTLDALLGPREDEDALYDAGKIGRLFPNGNVESERAALVGSLDRFVTRLHQLRRFLQTPHTAETWRDGLLAAIDGFYEATDASLGELLGLRKAVDAVATAAIKARDVDGRSSEELVSPEVFCKAATEALKDGMRKLFSAGDAVRIAPLSAGSAVPARFVWICGLNDGTFPRNEYRPTFDLIGRHPTMFDVTPRERDAMALLKAAMGARGRLCLSYVGRDIRTNAEIPPAVPLADLLEWFRASGIPVRDYIHPLHPYSGEYFLEGDKLPPSYSATNRETAAALAKIRENGTTDETALPLVVPFPFSENGENTIDLEELAEFCAQPNRFLAKKRLGLRIVNPEMDLVEDDDGLDAGLPFALSLRIKIRGKDAIPDLSGQAEALAESGLSLTDEEIVQEVEAQDDATAPFREKVLAYKDGLPEYQNPDIAIAKALADWEDDAVATPLHIAFSEGDHPVMVTGAIRAIPLTMRSGGQMEHVFSYSAKKEENAPSEKIRAWIRHLAGHAAGGHFVTVVVFGDKKPGPARTFRPIEAETAKQRLGAVVQMVQRPFPFDVAAASGFKDDCLTEDGLAALGDYMERIVSTQQPKGRKTK